MDNGLQSKAAPITTIQGPSKSMSAHSFYGIDQIRQKLICLSKQEDIKAESGTGIKILSFSIRGFKNKWAGAYIDPLGTA
jgi:hypothetical protein